MSVEQAPLHTIRMSEQDWNELLVTAVNAGYKSRTEYIRATLKMDKLWQMKQPDDEMEAAIANATANTKWQAATASLEVYTNDAVKFLARAEAAEAEVMQLQAELEAMKNASPIMENPQILRRPPLKTIVDSWPDKKRAKWDAEKWKAEQWAKDVLDTAYAIMDSA